MIYSHLSKLEPAYSKMHTKIINPTLNSSNWPVYTEVKKTQTTKNPSFFHINGHHIFSTKEQEIQIWEKDE